MRSLFLLVLIAGALAMFMVGSSRVRYMEDNVCAEEFPVVEAPVVRVKRPTVVVQHPNIKRIRLARNNEPGYSFPVKGYAPTTEEAKRDALDQASQVVKTALRLKHTRVDQSQLEKMITDTLDVSDVPLGTSGGSELGAGKQISMTFELPNDYIRELGQKERGYVMMERMGWLASGLAVIVAGLFAITGYVRLDEWSKGYFSGVLKAVAVLAVIGAGVAVYVLR